MIDPTTFRSALHADWRSDTHTASGRKWWQRCTDVRVTPNVCLRVRATVCLGGSGAVLAPGGYAWVMDTSARSNSLPTNQPFMILHLQMQNTPIIDAVIKWCFNLPCLWLERKQPIHLTNEVISAIGWPCRFTYGHCTVCEALSELCWPCLEGGWKSEWIRWISDPSNPNLAWPILKSVKIRHKIDRKEYFFAILCSLTFLGIMINLAPSFRFLCQHRIKWDLDKIKDNSG